MGVFFIQRIIIISKQGSKTCNLIGYNRSSMLFVSFTNVMSLMLRSLR